MVSSPLPAPKPCTGCRESFFCANSSPSTRSVISATACHQCHTPHPSFGSDTGSIGVRPWLRCNLRHLPLGIARAFSCSGSGNPIPDACRFLWNLQALIRRMVRDNLTWGEERITNDFLLKLCLQVSPRTVRQYMPKRLEHGRGNRARLLWPVISAWWFPATFRLLYVFVLLEHATSTYPAHQCDGTPTASGYCSSCGKRSRLIMAAASCCTIR